MEKKTTLTLIAVAVAFTCIGLATGYVYMSNKMEASPIPMQEEALGIAEEVAKVSTGEDKITPSTKIVYRYYYTEDNVIETQEEVPPYFLLDLTLSDMLKYYATWDIVSFSSREVIMQKTVIGASNQRYVVGEKDGYIAVFYEEEQEGISLKEITEIPVTGFVEDEIFRLKEGIKVIGNDALARILENYGS